MVASKTLKKKTGLRVGVEWTEGDFKFDAGDPSQTYRTNIPNVVVDLYRTQSFKI